MDEIYTSVIFSERQDLCSDEGFSNELIGLKRRAESLSLDEDESLNFSSLREKSSINKKDNVLYSCEIEGCNKTYSQKYRLLIHQRTHVSELSINCRLDRGKALCM